MNIHRMAQEVFRSLVSGRVERLEDGESTRIERFTVLLFSLVFPFREIINFLVGYKENRSVYQVYWD